MRSTANWDRWKTELKNVRNGQVRQNDGGYEIRHYCSCILQGHIFSVLEGMQMIGPGIMERMIDNLLTSLEISLDGK